jgi:hypothetical protein
MNEEETIKLIKETVRSELSQLVSNDRFIFRKDIQLTSGIKFRNYLGAQPATIADANGLLADATTKINTIIDRLQELGLIA